MDSPDITTDHYLSYDLGSEVIMYSKNIDEEIAPASITKIMTALVLLDYFDFDENITTSLPEDYVYDGKVAYIESGTIVTTEDLLELLLIYSANDAAYAAAMAVSGDIESFVEKMNIKATSFGMNDTYFLNPDGLDEYGHKTSLRDLLTLSLKFIENYKLVAITSKSSFSSNVSGIEKVYKSTNQIIDRGFIGIKTGWTSQAGLTFIGLKTEDSRQILTIVNKSIVNNDKTNHFIDTQILYEESFNNFGYFENISISQPLYNIRNSNNQITITSSDPWVDFLNKSNSFTIDLINYSNNRLSFSNTISDKEVRLNTSTYEVLWKFNLLEIFSFFAN